ncbi:hypothetical protein N7495_000361 [Penicillium taxi]|uniref:uncharacterized protein n=1 Tax=Penicillium taxi TaxID=168475 RepID=UPI0025454AE3|nr:uncharacterized protein N7495_000361 [Penicillium taxi]KAJ5907679.1 hypothetical protein N7495_000361 [Penicillium taxi]
MSTIVNSKWGQDILLSPSALESQVSSCSTSGYSATYTPTSTASSIVSASATVTASRCNTTNPDQTVYKVESGDTCVSISAAQNVSTSALINLNSLDIGCTHIVAGAEICLPDVCEIHRVQETDTIDKIVDSLSRQVSVPQFVAWNANLNSVQSSENLTAITGKYIYASPPGTLTLPDTLALKPATTAIYVNLVYNITEDDLTDEMYEYQAWMSEYERVCYLPTNGTFPTVGFNFSITLTDDSSVGSSTMFTSSQTASPHASPTATTAISTTTTSTTTAVTSPSSTISENGLYGVSSSGWTCLGSQFGDCCSNYGYCGSSSDYCSSANCDAQYGSCS